MKKGVHHCMHLYLRQPVAMFDLSDTGNRQLTEPSAIGLDGDYAGKGAA